MILLRTLLFLLLAATPAVAEEAPRDQYLFVLSARNNPYWNAVQQGIEETAKMHDVDAVVYRTQDATAAEEQLNSCMTAIEQHPKVIVMAAITPGVGLQCLKQAAAAGIVVGDIDSNTTVEDARTAGFPLAFSVGSDNTQLGAKAADFAASILPQPAPHILILEGAPGSIPGAKRIAGFRDRLKHLKPDAVVTAMPANWETEKAVTTTDDALQRDPALALIFAANDTMALGASEALRAAGKTGTVKIVGIDGIEAVRKAIMAGTISGSVAQLPYLMGKRALERAIDSAATGKTGNTEPTPIPLLTRQSLSDKTDPDLQYVR